MFSAKTGKNVVTVRNSNLKRRIICYGILLTLLALLAPAKEVSAQMKTVRVAMCIKTKLVSGAFRHKSAAEPGLFIRRDSGI